MRFGSTIGNGTRIIDIEPGPKTAPELPDGGIITNKDTVEATEFDEIFDTFDGKTRKRPAGHVQGHRRHVRPAPAALGDGGDRDRSRPGGGRRLRRRPLPRCARAAGVRRQHQPRDAHARRAPRQIVRPGAGRRHDLQRRSRATPPASRARWTGSPPTLRETRTTLDAPGHVGRAPRQPADGPAAPALGSSAAWPSDLRPALASLRKTMPVAVADVPHRAAGSPGDHLAAGNGRSRSPPRRRRPCPTLAPMVGCIRPYAPEIDRPA